MTETLATLLAVGVVVVVCIQTFRGPSRGRVTAARGASVGAGLLAALALATLAPSLAERESVSLLALGLGGMAAVAAVAHAFRPLVEWGYGTIGALAAVPAMVDVVAGPPCPGDIGLGGRVATVAALVLAAASAVAGVVLFGRIGPMPVLAWFGVVEVLAFLQAPGGLPIALSGIGPAVLALGVAAVLGLLAALRPNLVVTAATVCIALANLGLDEARLSCEGALGSSGAVTTALVLYLAAFVGLRALLRWFGR